MTSTLPEDDDISRPPHPPRAKPRSFSPKLRPVGLCSEMVTRHCWSRRLGLIFISAILLALLGIVSGQRELVQTLDNKRGHNVGLRMMCLVHPRNCRGGFKKRAKTKSSLRDKEEVISKEWLWILQTVRSANREDAEVEEDEADGYGFDSSPLLSPLERQTADGDGFDSSPLLSPLGRQTAEDFDSHLLNTLSDQNSDAGTVTRGRRASIFS